MAGNGRKLDDIVVESRFYMPAFLVPKYQKRKGTM